MIRLQKCIRPGGQWGLHLGAHDTQMRVIEGLRRVDRLQRWFLLLEFTEYRVGTDAQRSCRIAHPTGIETHVDAESLHLRQTDSVAIVEQKSCRHGPRLREGSCRDLAHSDSDSHPSPRSVPTVYRGRAIALAPAYLTSLSSSGKL